MTTRIPHLEYRHDGDSCSLGCRYEDPLPEG